MPERVSHRLITLAYRIRPDQPAAAVAPITLAANAHQTCITKDVPLQIAVWNTFKGQRERYYDLLTMQTADADLILLQEFWHDLSLEAAHRSLFARRDASMAVSFYTRPNQAAPTGVCTISAVRATKTVLMLSRYYEPVTRTPKTAICSYYPIACADGPPDQSLLVLNSHAINFRLRRPFRDQMLQFEAQLRQHMGPMILVGDFNTWEQGRVRILDAVADRIGLRQIHFPRGIKTFGRHELDRVYVRGGVVAQQRVIVDRAASDHNLLAFHFTVR